MKPSFGPVIVQEEKTGPFRAHCNWCTFRNKQICRYVSPERVIPDTDNTPGWCPMLEGMLRDAADMASGVEHKVVRWSGRRTDDPRVVFDGIPSEALRQFRLASRNVKRGTLRLIDDSGKELMCFPEAVA